MTQVARIDWEQLKALARGLDLPQVTESVSWGSRT